MRALCPSRVVESIVRLPARSSLAGFPLAVAYKFGDDQGPYSTALITYYGFLSLVPLLLLLVTVLGFVLQGDSDLQARLVNSTRRAPDPNSARIRLGRSRVSQREGHDPLLEVRPDLVGHPWRRRSRTFSASSPHQSTCFFGRE